MQFDIMKDFLETEICDQQMYNAIIEFLQSHEIREGKFEANKYLLNKLTRETVIIYQEFETPCGWEYSAEAKIFDIKMITMGIHSFAKNRGLVL